MIKHVDCRKQVVKRLYVQSGYLKLTLQLKWLFIVVLRIETTFQDTELRANQGCGVVFCGTPTPTPTPDSMARKFRTRDSDSDCDSTPLVPTSPRTGLHSSNDPIVGRDLLKSS